MVASILSNCLGALLLFSEVALAANDVKCRKYIPQGRTSNVGILQFTGHGTLSYIPTINALAGFPVVLDPKHKAGTTFNFESCNSTSLDVHPYQLRGCNDNGCDVNWYDTIRVVNPPTGHCMTGTGLVYPTEELFFYTCNNTSPNDGQQFFTTLQTVHYPGANYTGKPVIGPVHFVPYGMDPFYDDSDPTAAWTIGKNNKTILWPVPVDGVSENALLGVLIVKK